MFTKNPRREHPVHVLALHHPSTGKDFPDDVWKIFAGGATSGFGRVSPEAEGLEDAGSPWLPAGRITIICLSALGILYTEVHATREVVQVESAVHGQLGTAQK